MQSGKRRGAKEQGSQICILSLENRYNSGWANRFSSLASHLFRILFGATPFETEAIFSSEGFRPNNTVIASIRYGLFG